MLSRGRAHYRANKNKRLAELNKWAEDHPIQRLLYATKCRAKRRCLDFNLEAADLFFPGVCPILGLPLVRGRGKSGPALCSLDRKDNSRGYVKGNVQIISLRANVMKSDATPTELILFATWILKTYAQKSQ